MPPFSFFSQSLLDLAPLQAMHCWWKWFLRILNWFYNAAILPRVPQSVSSASQDDTDADEEDDSDNDDEADNDIVYDVYADIDSAMRPFCQEFPIHWV